MFGSTRRPGMRGDNSINLGSLTGSSLAGSSLGSGGIGSLGADENTGTITATVNTPPTNAAPAPAKTGPNWLLIGGVAAAAWYLLKKKR